MVLSTFDILGDRTCEKDEADGFAIGFATPESSAQVYPYKHAEEIYP
jgi:uncharacterized zinc-type alcohol dehydrogenase-like protein